MALTPATILHDVFALKTFLNTRSFFVCNFKLLCQCISVCEDRRVINIIIGVFTCILAVGLTVLFGWKIYVTVHDRREYARFEEERKLTSFGTVIFLFICLDNAVNMILC